MMDLDARQVKAALAAVPDATAIVDEDGTILYASDRLRATFGYAPMELVGEPIEMLLPAELRDRHAVHRETYFEAPQSRPMGSGLDLFGLHKDGHVFPVDISLNATETGNQRLLICAIRDVSKRKRRDDTMQAELVSMRQRVVDSDAHTKFSEERFRLLIEHTPAAIAMLDRELRYIMVSRRWLEDYGLDGRDVTGASHYEVFPEIPERWREAHRKCLAGEVVRSEEDSFIRADGSVEWLCWGLYPWREADGRIGGIIIFSEVITKRKLAELALIGHQRELESEVAERTRALVAAKDDATRANELKSRFLTAVSHDLRQPLQSIAVLTDILGKRVSDPQSKLIAGKIDDSIANMVEIIDSVLEIGQIDSGETAPQVTRFAIATVLSRKLGEFVPMAEAKGLKVRFVNSSAVIRSDRVLLERAVGNLLSNAVKYSQSGRILLGCRRRGAALRIEVWDTGIGIEENQLQNIFREFYRVPAESKREAGLGLGLFLVREITTLLGHPVEVRSTPCKGTMFAITVPMDTPERRAGGRNAAPVLLVVEDDDAQRRNLEMLFEAEGYRVLAGRDGDDALAAITAPGGERPDAMLCDYDLGPGQKNGLDVIRAVRKIHRANIPAAVLTGNRSASLRHTIETSGCVYIAKPSQAMRLLTAIDGFVAATRPGWVRSHGPRAAPAAAAPQPAKSNIGIVDDDPLIRDAFRLVLEAEGYRVTTYATAEAFLDDPRRAELRCVIADLRLPGLDGLGLLNQIKSEGGSLPVIMITGRGELSGALEAIRAGAADFLSKPVGSEAITAAIERAIAGSAALGEVPARPGADDRLASLTPRERQVLDGMLEGKQTKVIAHDLGISMRTVEHHRQRVMHKMGAKSLAMLVRMTK